MTRFQAVGGDDAHPPHAAPAARVLEVFGTDPEHGLSEESAATALGRAGPNKLEEPPPAPWWTRLLNQFRELVVWILIAAVAISAALGELLDAAAIGAIVVLNAALGFFQEERAARALRALRQLTNPEATVVRDGHRRVIPARDVVPGDLIELEAGDEIPADARLLHAFAFRTQESALTGESRPISKNPTAALQPETPLAERINMAYTGTVVTSGRATAVVTGTGMATEIGRIAELLERPDTRPTPLQRRMAELGRVLVYVCLGIVLLIGALYAVRGENLLGVFLLAVSLAVAAVPEGLPAVVTVVLALGLQRMVKRRALVRRLPSVETLGSVTVVCSDKTGTLTQNEMTVRAVVAGERLYAVGGIGYEPRGDFHRLDRPGSALSEAIATLPLAWDGDLPGPPIRDPASEPDLLHLLTIAARCNHARVVPGEGGASPWRAEGDPTEAALVSVAVKAGVPGANEERPVLFEIPFEPERRMMSVVVDEDGAATGFIKGAPETLLPRCTHERRGGRVEALGDGRRAEIMAESAALAARSLRVLGFACRERVDPPATFEERELVFAGLAGMLDPPRRETRQAVETCVAAGIRPVMITGDHPQTARAVAREVGLAGSEEEAVTGPELDAMDRDALVACVERSAVFARVSAEHKLRIVEALQSHGHVVGMTGDGVNDAPAVHTADIGIAMGRTGTDVTREAADMVLLDDDFSTIVAAVEEGRGIFDNIQKFVHYLLSTNAGEVLLMLFAALAGWPVPLVAVQLLWINLVTDGLPALALGLEPPEPEVMHRAPRHPRTPVITARQGRFIVIRGMMVAAVAATGFAWAHAGDPANVSHARSVAFSVAAFAQLLFSFAFRSQQRTLLELGLFSNRALLAAVVTTGLLQILVMETRVLWPFFEMEEPLGGHWWLVIGLSFLPVTLVEVGKIVRRALGMARPT